MKSKQHTPETTELEENSIVKMSDKFYFGLPFMSKHELDDFVANPYAYTERKKAGLPTNEASSDALSFGSAVHCAVLEPEHYNDTFAIIPPEIKARRGATWEAFKAEIGERQTIKAEDNLVVEAIAQAIPKNKLAKKLLDACPSHLREITAIWKHPDFKDVPLKSKIDFVSENKAIVGDLKTTQNASPDAFIKDCDNFGYHLQAAFYMDAMRACGYSPDTFAFLVVEKTYPFTPAVYTFSYDSLFISAGRAAYMRNLELYRDYQTHDPEEELVGFSHHNLDLPPWSKALKILNGSI